MSNYFNIYLIYIVHLKDFSIEDEQSKKLTELLYKEVRNRTHFGKIAVTY